MKIGDLVRYRNDYIIILEEYKIRDRDAKWWVVLLSDNSTITAVSEKHMEVINGSR